jgi:hypothetical protein
MASSIQNDIEELEQFTKIAQRERTKHVLHIGIAQAQEELKKQQQTTNEQAVPVQNMFQLTSFVNESQNPQQQGDQPATKKLKMTHIKEQIHCPCCGENKFVQTGNISKIGLAVAVCGYPALAGQFNKAGLDLKKQNSFKVCHRCWNRSRQAIRRAKQDFPNVPLFSSPIRSEASIIIPHNSFNIGNIKMVSNIIPHSCMLILYDYLLTLSFFLSFLVSWIFLKELRKVTSI